MAQTMTPAQQAKADDAAAAADAEAEDAAVEAAPKPDPKLVPGLTMETLTHVVSLVESMASLTPLSHSLAARVAAMRASLAATVFHASPPA